MSVQEEMRAWRGRLHITQAQAARQLQTPRGTYCGWEAGRFEPPPMIRLAMRCIEHHPPVRDK